MENHLQINQTQSLDNYKIRIKFSGCNKNTSCLNCNDIYCRYCGDYDIDGYRYDSILVNEYLLEEIKTKGALFKTINNIMIFVYNHMIISTTDDDNNINILFTE